MKKLGSPRGNGVSVGPLDDEVRDPAAADGKSTFVGSGLNVNPHHVDADGGTTDITKFQVISVVPVLDYRVFASELRDIA